MFARYRGRGAGGDVVTEHEEQAALLAWCGYAKATVPELGLLFAIPNGGRRHIKVAADLKVEGVKAGVPDLFLPVARGEYHGLFIELKTTQGRLSAEQKRWLAALTEQGYLAVCCHGWDEARREISGYLRSGVAE